MRRICALNAIFLANSAALRYILCNCRLQLRVAMGLQPRIDCFLPFFRICFCHRKAAEKTTAEENEMIDNAKTGAYIAYLRQRAGMTQTQLANMMNVTHQAVSKWENGGSQT